MEEITLDLFTKYLAEFKAEYLDLERAQLQTRRKVSNLEDYASRTMAFLRKLPTVWKLRPYKDKQIFQKVVWNQLSQDKWAASNKKINSVFLYVAQMMRDVAKIKVGESKLIFDIPHLVVSPGIEPGTQGFSVLCSTD